MLRGGAATDPRHRTLRALVDWSFDRLSAPERELFEIVSVFAGDFSLDDAEQVATGLQSDRRWNAAEVVTGLTGLVEQSMITRRPGGSAYALLETVRAYGRERLAARGLETAVYRAHAEHYAAQATVAHDDLFGAGQMERVARQEAAIDELRAAFWWSFEHDPGLAAELVGGLGVPGPAQADRGGDRLGRPVAGPRGTGRSHRLRGGAGCAPWRRPERSSPAICPSGDSGVMGGGPGRSRCDGPSDGAVPAR